MHITSCFDVEYPQSAPGDGFTSTLGAARRSCIALTFGDRTCSLFFANDKNDDEQSEQHVAAAAAAAAATAAAISDAAARHCSSSPIDLISDDEEELSIASAAATDKNRISILYTPPLTTQGLKLLVGEFARMLVGLPFNSRNEGFKMGIDDMTSNVCQALRRGAWGRSRARRRRVPLGQGGC